jgi:hypothetical protein
VSLLTPYTVKLAVELGSWQLAEQLVGSLTPCTVKLAVELGGSLLGT